MNWMYGSCSTVVALLYAIFVLKAFFDDWSDFFYSLRLSLTPDLINLFRGEYQDGQWADLKMWVYLFTTGGCGFGTYHLLLKYFH